MKKIIYGAGKLGIQALFVLGEECVQCFCDTFRYGGTVYGKKIISPAELQLIAHEYEILIACDATSEVIQILKQNKIDSFTIFRVEKPAEVEWSITKVITPIDTLQLPLPQFTPKLKKDFPKNFEQVLENLAEDAPEKAFAYWKILYERGKPCYKTDMVHNCAIHGHRMSKYFDDFLQKFLRAFKSDVYVLDIGCGPQDIPSYLENYNLSYIYGIDPLNAFGRHPFKFYQTIAEYLPFENNSFQLVCSATSLDHVLLLDKVVEEIFRVLAPGGILCIWDGMFPGLKPFDVYSENIMPADDYHMFHFSKDWFESLWKNRFSIVEHIQYHGFNHFYAFQKTTG